MRGIPDYVAGFVVGFIVGTVEGFAVVGFVLGTVAGFVVGCGVGFVAAVLPGELLENSLVNVG
jgi:hypothetical protein